MRHKDIRGSVGKCDVARLWFSLYVAVPHYISMFCSSTGLSWHKRERSKGASARWTCQRRRLSFVSKKCWTLVMRRIANGCRLRCLKFHEQLPGRQPGEETGQLIPPKFCETCLVVSHNNNLQSFPPENTSWLRSWQPLKAPLFWSILLFLRTCLLTSLFEVDHRLLAEIIYTMVNTW